MDINQRLAIEDAVDIIINAIGEDVTRPGLKDTPARVARFWEEFVDYDPGKVNTTFEAVTTDQLVAVSGIRVYSLCEHHLLPFWADISIGYLAQDRVLGLSKFARIAHKHAHKLQIQERLVDEIAAEVALHTKSLDVAVVAKGVHMCMVMRGIKAPHTMTSSAMHGVFRDSADLRREFLSLVP